MADTASQFIGDIPRYYDEGLGPVIFESFARDIAARASKAGAANVLELAAGTGIVSRKLRDALAPDARLVVTDLNEPMLEIARRKFRHGEAVEFTPADAMQLDFPDNTFDLIVCQFGVMFFPDKIAAFREAARVLAPGKPYLFNTWRTMAENPFSLVAFDAAAKFFPDNPPVFYRVPFSYPDPATVVADMEAAGFRDIACASLAVETRVNSWREFARGVVLGNPLAGEIVARGGVSPDEVIDAVESRYRKKWGDEPAKMPLSANVFIGYAP